jgi:hypothetical protein
MACILYWEQTSIRMPAAFGPNAEAQSAYRCPFNEDEQDVAPTASCASSG